MHACAFGPFLQYRFFEKHSVVRPSPATGRRIRTRDGALSDADARSVFFLDKRLTAAWIGTAIHRPHEPMLEWEGLIALQGKAALALARKMVVFTFVELRSGFSSTVDELSA